MLILDDHFKIVIGSYYIQIKKKLDDISRHIGYEKQTFLTIFISSKNKIADCSFLTTKTS